MARAQVALIWINGDNALHSVWSRFTRHLTKQERLPRPDRRTMIQTGRSVSARPPGQLPGGLLLNRNTGALAVRATWPLTCALCAPADGSMSHCGSAVR
jgi:hypothetical protein